MRNQKHASITTDEYWAAAQYLAACVGREVSADKVRPSSQGWTPECIFGEPFIDDLSRSLSTAPHSVYTAPEVILGNVLNMLVHRGELSSAGEYYAE